jgi:hypothetical protein
MRKLLYAAAGGVVIAATVATASLPAAANAAKIVPAATSACAGACTDFSFKNPGPGSILTDHSALITKNNLIRLTPGTNGAPKLDFAKIDVGTVDFLYCNINGTSQDTTVFTNRQCKLLQLAHLGLATTFQLAFNPNNGGDETMCVGAWNNAAPVSGFKMRLVECGVGADTVLIETNKIPAGGTAAGYNWLINGGSDNYSTPLVATSNGNTNSQPTWSTARLNGQKAIDTQETAEVPGPF